jgi:hypothetical protein
MLRTPFQDSSREGFGRVRLRQSHCVIWPGILSPKSSGGGGCNSPRSNASRAAFTEIHPLLFIPKDLPEKSAKPAGRGVIPTYRVPFRYGFRRCTRSACGCAHGRSTQSKVLSTAFFHTPYFFSLSSCAKIFKGIYGCLHFPLHPKHLSLWPATP